MRQISTDKLCGGQEPTLIDLANSIDLESYVVILVILGPAKLPGPWL